MTEGDTSETAAASWAIGGDAPSVNYLSCNLLLGGSCLPIEGKKKKQITKILPPRDSGSFTKNLLPVC